MLWSFKPTPRYPWKGRAVWVGVVNQGPPVLATCLKLGRYWPPKSTLPTKLLIICQLIIQWRQSCQTWSNRSWWIQPVQLCKGKSLEVFPNSARRRGVAWRSRAATPSKLTMVYARLELKKHWSNATTCIVTQFHPCSTLYHIVQSMSANHVSRGLLEKHLHFYSGAGPETSKKHN